MLQPLAHWTHVVVVIIVIIIIIVVVTFLFQVMQLTLKVEYKQMMMS